MNEIHIFANVVITLKDGFTNTRALQGNVAVYTHTNSYAKKKADGCYVFSNFRSGLYRITVNCTCYANVTFDVEMDDKVKYIDVVLMPTRAYRFDVPVTVIHGNSDKKVKMAFPVPDRQLRILGDANEGDTKLYMYIQEELREDKICLCVKKEENIRQYDVYKSKDDIEPSKYSISPPLLQNVSSEDELCLAYEALPDSDNNFFAAVRGSYDKVYILDDQAYREIAIEGNDLNINIGQEG